MLWSQGFSTWHYGALAWGVVLCVVECLATSLVLNHILSWYPFKNLAVFSGCFSWDFFVSVFTEGYWSVAFLWCLYLAFLSMHLTIWYFHSTFSYSSWALLLLLLLLYFIITADFLTVTRVFPCPSLILFSSLCCLFSTSAVVRPVVVLVLQSVVLQAQNHALWTLCLSVCLPLFACCHATWPARILVLWPGIEPGHGKVLSPNHWTAGEFLCLRLWIV